MKKTSFPLLVSALLVIALTSACNMPRAEAGTPTPDVTQAYQTVEARLTEAAVQTPDTLPTPPPTEAPTAEASPTSAPPSPTSLPPATTAPTTSAKLCDQAEAGSPIDVTIPDNTNMAPGQSFTKVWRLHNSGTCTWSKKYSIAVFSGEPMNAPDSVPLPKQVEPGQTVDISVDLVAPATAGNYQGNWKLLNASGAWFGIGPGANSPFWVRIAVSGGTVTASNTPTEENGATATLAATNPPVQANGTNSLKPGDGLDLDTNHLNGGGEDVGVITNDQNKLLLVTVGNAGMVGFGGSAPSYAQCSAAGMGSASTNAKNLPKGFYICYRTDQGLIGWMRIMNFNEDTGVLNVQINTWASP